MKTVSGLGGPLECVMRCGSLDISETADDNRLRIVHTAFKSKFATRTTANRGLAYALRTTACCLFTPLRVANRLNQARNYVGNTC